MMRNVFAALLIACALHSPAGAFRSTDVESFTDPDFVAFRPTTVVIFAAVSDLTIARRIEQRLISGLAKSNIKAVGSSELFPPTRPLESYDLHGTFRERGIDSALVVVPGDRVSDVNYLGMQSHSTTTAIGNQSSTSSIRSPVMAVTSSSQFTATLLALGPTPDETRTAWVAQILAKASGSAFVGSRGDANAAVRAILRALSEDGHMK